jgi:hypothetical protein
MSDGASQVCQKNIAIFADGIGNNAAKLNKTNVWRLDQALNTDINQAPIQLATIMTGRDLLVQTACVTGRRLRLGARTKSTGDV